MLQISDMCNTTEHFEYLTSMALYHFKTNDDKMALKFGKDAISIFHRTNSDFSILSLHNIYLLMGSSLMKLGNFKEALHYLSEDTFKSCVDNYKNGLEIFIYFLKTIIDCQLKNKQYDIALKLCSEIPIFNWKSIKPDNVEHEFNTIFSQIECQFKIDELTKKYDLEFYTSQFASLAFIRDICFLKCQIYKGLNDLINCSNWIDLLIRIFNNFHLFQMQLDKHGEKFQHGRKENLILAIYAILDLIQTVCNPIERQQHFHWLFCMIIHSTKNEDKHFVYYMETTMKNYDINLDDVIPFLEFSIKNCLSEETVASLASLNPNSRREGWSSDINHSYGWHLYRNGDNGLKT